LRIDHGDSNRTSGNADERSTGALQALGGDAHDEFAESACPQRDHHDAIPARTPRFPRPAA